MNTNLFCIKAGYVYSADPVNNIKNIYLTNTKDIINKDNENRNLLIECDNEIYRVFIFNEYIDSLNKNKKPVQLYADDNPINFDLKMNLFVKFNQNEQTLQVSDDGVSWSSQKTKTRLSSNSYKFISPLVDCAYCYKDKKLFIHDYENTVFKTSLNMPEENMLGMVASEYQQSVFHRFLNPVSEIEFSIPGSGSSFSRTNGYLYDGCVDSYSELPNGGVINKTVYKVKRQNCFFILGENNTWVKTFPIFKIPQNKKNIQAQGLYKRTLTFFYTDKTIIIEIDTMNSTILPKTFLIDNLQTNKAYTDCEIIDNEENSIMSLVGEVELIDSFKKRLRLVGIWSHGYKGIVPLYFDQVTNSVKSCASGDFKAYEYLVTEEHVMGSFFSEAGCLIPVNSFNLTHDEYQIWNMLSKKGADLNLSHLLENDFYIYPGHQKYVRYIS